MEYLIGLLSGVVFFIVFLTGMHYGQRLNKKQKPPDPDEKAKLEAQRLNEDFQKLFSYDVAQATERKKV